MNKDEKLEDNKDIDKNKIELEEFKYEPKDNFIKTLRIDISSISNNRLLALL